MENFVAMSPKGPKELDTTGVSKHTYKLNFKMKKDDWKRMIFIFILHFSI